MLPSAIRTDSLSSGSTWCAKWPSSFEILVCLDFATFLQTCPDFRAPISAGKLAGLASTNPFCSGTNRPMSADPENTNAPETEPVAANPAPPVAESSTPPVASDQTAGGEPDGGDEPKS